MAGRVVAVGIGEPVVAVQIERRHLGAIVEAAASEREAYRYAPLYPYVILVTVFSSRGRNPPLSPSKEMGFIF